MIYYSYQTKFNLMKTKLFIYTILLFSLCQAEAQINCGNLINESTGSVEVIYIPPTTTNVHQIDFKTIDAISETTGGISLWLKVDGAINPAPMIDEASLTGDLVVSQQLTNNEFGDGNHYYLLTTSAQINPSVLFITGESRTISAVSFDVDILAEDIEVVLTSPTGQDAIDFGGGTYQYLRTALTVCNGGEDSHILPAPNILPITLKSFNAESFQNRDVNLNWVTSTEMNGSHFELERSDDGVHFTQIGRVETAGESKVDQEYEYIDRAVNLRRNMEFQYYRIKMVDFDGEYEYSVIRVVNFERSDSDFSINAYPNPTSDFVQLELDGLDETSTERPTLNIFSNTGELVKSQVLNSDLGKIDVTNLPDRLYHVMISYKGKKYTEKIVVIK